MDAHNGASDLPLRALMDSNIAGITERIPLTLAEQSAFQRTGRTTEVEMLAQDYARRWPDAVRSIEYGRSCEGRPLRALLVTRTDAFTPEELHARRIPLLMIQAGIHPGESDGKDAGFIVLRELLAKEVLPQALDGLAILFVPAFNTDGHERVGQWNRPNQVGPQEMGWRTTARNLNLNRDYTKADAPEMQALLQLINRWDPLITADMHVTDGADFEPDISIQVEPIHQGDPELYSSGTQLRDELIEKLAACGALPLPFYPDLFSVDDPASGFVLTVYSPRFSTGYFPARNRFTVLVETHSWKTYAVRVRTSRNTIIALIELALLHGGRWLEEVSQSDIRTAQLAGKPVALEYAAGWREPLKAPAADFPANANVDTNITTIDFRGYAYTRSLSPISGELVTTYDPTTPQIWRVPFRSNTKPSLSINAPRAGYLVPAGYAGEIGAKLKLHGIAFKVLDEPRKIDAGAFRAMDVKFSTTPFEGRMRATIDGSWCTEVRDLPAGSLFVPISQSRARLLMALLEPQAPDSFAAWGFFSGCFEAKEYIEPYVAEMIARDLLARDSALATEFSRKLKEEPDFAASPIARLEFFLRRHASWDEQLNLYPIFRLEHPL
jgi:murein tripeptide amidase MpaA